MLLLQKMAMYCFIKGGGGLVRQPQPYSGFQKRRNLL
ncbi:MAG: hypothetical protein ACJAZA_000757 [Shewanella psychromarinicola]|jgi:hypothetical protein